MIELQGKYNCAKIYTDNVEQTAISQIIELCNQEFIKDSKIRIMPDTHAGAGCVIGTTMTIQDKVVPNLVGVDIGCGMYCVKLKEKNIDFESLDNVIREFIPHGCNTRNTPHELSLKINIKELRCIKNISYDRAINSLGTLGGGNHFIEVNNDSDNNIYLVIHSGSRYLGKQVAEYYQNLGYNKLQNNRDGKIKIINKLKAEGRDKDIQALLSKLPTVKIKKELSYIEGEDLSSYLNDIDIVQRYATLNREIMAKVILDEMKLSAVNSFTTIHNYIDVDDMILRKGAISANKGEKVIIPINMRDGSIIAIGKGNEDWNNSAPHGAGRILSRSKAKERFTLDEFKDSMSKVWTTSVCESTIDESPMAYKPMDEIIGNIKDTVDIETIIKPLYNFKSSK